ncbi:MAG: outer membrane beta-barrel protein [Elusimicrobia bacterium]|nr:outer membrane beta-barrel protein [Elusimicrobiota bacterium]
MKKSLIVLILAVALVSPVFATEKGNIEIVGKLGVAVNPTDAYVFDDYYYNSYKKNNALAIAIEGFYSLLPELPVGLGINYQFNSERTKEDDYETGATNIYLTVKPTAKIDSKIFTGIYAIGQIGFSLNRGDGRYWAHGKVDSNGLYWGLGAGTEIMNDFIFEFIFSTNNWKYDFGGLYHGDIQSTALTFFAGYKFTI